MSDDKALTTMPPPRAQIARSLDSASSGELIYLDKRGKVIGPTGMRLRFGFLWVYAGAVWTYTGVMLAATNGPLVAGGVVLFGAAFTGSFLLHDRAIRRANALVASHRRVEARAAFMALEGRRFLVPTSRHSIAAAIGELDIALGQPEDGLRRVDAELARLGRPWLAIKKLRRWRLGLVRATALARLGRLEAARAQLAEANAAVDARVQDSEYGQLMTQAVRLELAFAEGAPGDLPDDATLHEWARAGLARTAFGSVLVALAWAFHRRGDDDMARHLLAESESRLPVADELRLGNPRLADWAEEKRAAWDVRSGPRD